MKKVICTLAMLIVFGPLSLFSQVKKGFTIDGSIQGLKDGDIIKMNMLLELNADTIIDSCILKDGKFRLSGYLPEGPRMIEIFFPVITGYSKILRLLVDNGQNITLDCRDIYKIDHGYIENFVTVEGSPTNAALHYLMPVGTLYIQSVGRLNRLLNTFKDSIGFDVNLVDGVIQAKNQLNEALYFNFFQDR